MARQQSTTCVCVLVLFFSFSNLSLGQLNLSSSFLQDTDGSQLARTFSENVAQPLIQIWPRTYKPQSVQVRQAPNDCNAMSGGDVVYGARRKCRSQAFPQSCSAVGMSCPALDMGHAPTRRGRPSEKALRRL
eukprot:3231380-Rhodomonas_salina.4